MSEMLFDVVFKGKFSNQMDQTQAVSNFSKIFKQPPEKAILFFDGKERALKKSLSMDKANHIRAVLKKAGLRVSLKKLPSKHESTAGTSLLSEKKKEWKLDEPGAILAKKVEISKPSIDTSNLTLDKVGTQFAINEHDLPLELDISRLSLDDVGAVFAEKEIIEIPDFDIEDIEVDEVGSVFAKKEFTPAPEFNFEGLDVENVGEVFPQPEKPQKPNINIDDIELMD